MIEMSRNYITFNPLTAGAEYIRVFIFSWHSKYHFLNKLKIHWYQSVRFEKKLTSILSNLNNFHSLEVVARVSETRLHVGENSN